MAHTYNPSTQEAVVSRSLANLVYKESSRTVRAVTQRIRDSNNEKLIHFVCVCMCVCVCVCV